MVKYLRVGGFVRAVGVLIAGTAAANIVTAITLPIISRLYTPSDFSEFAVFNSIVAIIAVAGCLRFDVAIPLPQRDEDAKQVLVLSLLCAAVLAVLLGVVFGGFPQQLATWLQHPMVASLLWLIPVAVLCAALNSALQFWFVRRKEFGVIATSRVVQSVVGGGVQASLGVLGLAAAGLALGQTMNSLAGCATLAYRLIRTPGDGRPVGPWVQLRSQFLRLRRFPMYSAPEALANSAGIQLPVLLIAAMATRPEAGYVLLAMYVVQAPMSLIGSATAQVYLSRAPDEHRVGRLSELTVDVVGGLAKSGIGPLVFLALAAPELFALIFGREWLRAGELVTWMTPWFVLQFLASPISMALQVTNHQRTAFVLQLVGLVARVLAVYAASRLFGAYLSEAYALSGGLFYGLYLSVTLHAVRVSPIELFSKLRDALPWILAWAIAGQLVAVMMRSVLGL